MYSHLALSALLSTAFNKAVSLLHILRIVPIHRNSLIGNFTFKDERMFLCYKKEFFNTVSTVIKYFVFLVL